ncbi:MAG: DUF6141 family protein [Thermoanaerobaculia bacterium]
MKLEENSSPPVFREVQRFHPVFYFIVLISSFSIWVVAFIQIILKIPVGNNPASDTFLLIFLFLFGVLFPYIFLKIKLTTELRTDGIYVKMFPFHFKWQYFPFENIERAELIKYSPLKDYGGWGIRYGKGGKAYNARGNMAVMLYLKNGKKLLIGTQRGEEFIDILKSYLKNK